MIERMKLLVLLAFYFGFLYALLLGMNFAENVSNCVLYGEAPTLRATCPFPGFNEIK